jgi:glutamine---fructose-6-phosphate transaminase (isomerizing)
MLINQHSQAPGETMNPLSAIDIEIREAPDAVRRQSESLAAPLAGLLAILRRRPPRLAMTCARGSSAHVAIFGKYLLERHCGLPVAAAAPSVASIYHQRLKIDGQLFLAISQSGRSDDLVETVETARRSGALTVAIVNDADSPLAVASEIILPICAGLERSVAATKTFTASSAVLLRLVALWTGKHDMLGACCRLADRLAEASTLDWAKTTYALRTANSCATLGRGPTLSVAGEAALKLKEICDLHAEAYSSAEFCHGPIALVTANYPVLVFSPGDEASASVSEVAVTLRRKGALVLTTAVASRDCESLPVLPADHPDADAICLTQTFYCCMAGLAKVRGRDADQPRHLQKVTRTR